MERCAAGGIIRVRNFAERANDIASATLLSAESSGMTDRVTLITGAAAGIGAELARVFASRGHRLALVDRNGSGLAALARDMAAGGGAAPITIICDLEGGDAGERIAAALARQAVEVEYVVNN